MTGTGMDSHTDEVPNGTYQADIGITTIHAFCNDADGFAKLVEVAKENIQ